MLLQSKIKEKLIDKIRNTENEELLSQISRLVDFEAKIEDVYQFNEAQLKAINEGITQLDKGGFITNEESNSRVDQWLKR